LRLAVNSGTLAAMKPYSNDLRRRVVRAYESGEYTQDEVADLFGVCTATLRNFLRRQIATGSPDALPHAGGRAPTFNEDERKQLPALVKAHDDATLAELCQVAEQKFHKRVSPSSLCRLLHALRLPRKKVAPGR
jgi:transposase